MCKCHVFLHLSSSKFPNVQLGLVKDIIIIIVIIIIGCSCIIITLLFRNSPIKIGDANTIWRDEIFGFNKLGRCYYLLQKVKSSLVSSVTYANPIVYFLFLSSFHHWMIAGYKYLGWLLLFKLKVRSFSINENRIWVMAVCYKADWISWFLQPFLVI